MNDQVEEGKAKQAGKIGILTGLIALIELICGFIYLSKGGRDGSGLWSGAGLGVVAALGIVTWLKKNKIALVFYLVMCILWFIVSMIQSVYASFLYVVFHVIRKVVETNCNQIGDVCECHDTDETPVIVHNCDDLRTFESIFLCITMMSAAAAVLTLAGSIIGCKGTCCAQPAQPSNVVVMQQPGGYPVVMQQTPVTQEAYPAEPYPEQQSYPAQGGEAPPGYDQGGLPPKLEQQPAHCPVVMQQITMTQQEYPVQPYPGQQPVMLAQDGEPPPGYDQGGLPPKLEQQPARCPVVMQQITMTQQEYPVQPYPGQQPVMLAQGGGAPPGYDQDGLPPKQEQSTRF